MSSASRVMCFRPSASTTSATSSCDDGNLSNADNCVGTCPHSYCTVGVKLVATRDPCVKKICEVDPFCCSTSWDSACVSETQTVCKMPAAPNCK